MKASLHRRGRRALATWTAATLGLGLIAPSFSPTWAVEQGTDLPEHQTHAFGPADKISPSLAHADGDISVFVELRGQGAFASTQPKVTPGQPRSTVQAQARVQAIQREVASTGRHLASSAHADVLYTTHNALRGVALKGSAAEIRDLARRDDVVRISPSIPKTRSNAGSVIDTGTLQQWEQTGRTGRDVRIAVIDSGLDYTHADFGGPGTTQAYDTAHSSQRLPSPESGLYDPHKFLGGWDFAGDDYDGSDPDHAVPHPDDNPLDCKAGGHGTHVAGTAAGYGVTADGTTFRGDYRSLTEAQVRDMKIGPGTAPEAGLISFRVFGCHGSTNLTGEALDRVLDPNGDGDYSDAANIVNLSLGTIFAASDDPDNRLIDALTRQGVLSVVAAGNDGDINSVSGSPGNAASALTVANSKGSLAHGDGVRYTVAGGPEERAVGDYSANFPWTDASPKDLTGNVVVAPADNHFACEPFQGTRFDGRWVWIDWSDHPDSYPCGSAVRFDNIEKAGGKGVVLAGAVEADEAGIAGNSTIPGVRLNRSYAESMRHAAEEGNLSVSLSPELIGTQTFPSHALDTINESSSRGMHGSNGYTKPDVAAPGTSIASAGVGSGSGSLVESGTSMATPHTAGVAALVMEAHQRYTPSMIKAAIMNSATHHVTDAKGRVEAVDRVGSGRIDARAAVDQNVLVYDAQRPDIVGSSFGVLEIGDKPGTFRRDIVVDNRDSRSHTFDLGYEASTQMPGVEYSFEPRVSVGPGESRHVTITASVDPEKLAKTIDPTMQRVLQDRARQFVAAASGRLTLTEDGRQTRLPLHSAPKPVSAMKIEDANIEFGKGSHETSLAMTGHGVDHGGYTSMLGAFQLGESSPRVPTSDLAMPSLQNLDLQYVGATSNAPMLASQGKDVRDAMLGIGVSTWGNWDSLNPSRQISVVLDVNGDGFPDAVAMTSQPAGADYPVVSLVTYRNGREVVLDTQPINGAYGDLDTNPMDTNSVVLPISLRALGLDPSQTQQIQYSVLTYSATQRNPVDLTGWISYDPFHPDLWFSSGAMTTPVLHQDVPGTITAHRSDREEPSRALFLHLGNGTGDLSGVVQDEDGGKAQVVAARVASKPSGHDPRFSDVPQDYVFRDEIAWLADRGITTGWPDGTFRPGASVDRGQMAAFLYRLAGKPSFTPPSESPFSDVPTNHVFYKEISWLSATGITRGWPDGTFRPYAAVNRDQMAAFFYRMAGSPAFDPGERSSFTDVGPDAVFSREIAWMKEQGISKGWADGTFRPFSPVERGQMAAFLYRYDRVVLSRR